MKNNNNQSIDQSNNHRFI